MINFMLMARHVNVSPIADELGRNAAAWDLQTDRQRKIPCQRETKSIFLRKGVRLSTKITLEDSHDIAVTQIATQFMTTMNWLDLASKTLHGGLGRALFAKLPPHGRVYRHIDRGHYYAERNRFHLVIQSPGGSRMICGNEEVLMQEGDLWVFNNKEPHESINNSSQERTHLIFDLSIGLLKGL